MSAGTLAIRSNKYRPLSRRLEEKPLQVLDLLGVVVERDLVTSIVLLHEVRDQRTRLPAAAA